MKYILGVAAVVIALIVAIFVIATRPNSVPGAEQEGNRTTRLADEASGDAELVYTVEGRLVAEEKRREIKITVTDDSRKIEVFEGYTHKVLKSQTYPNNSAAYDTFVEGLAVAGFSRKRDSEFEDREGVCPFGRRYLYELKKDDKEPVDTWSTSCSAKQGTFGGNAGVVQQLFQGQIPNYSEFTQDVVL